MAVTHSRLYNTVSRYYPKYYSKEDVKVFVAAGKLTAEEYKEITGQVYQEEQGKIIEQQSERIRKLSELLTNYMTVEELDEMERNWREK